MRAASGAVRARARGRRGQRPARGPMAAVEARSRRATAGAGGRGRAGGGGRRAEPGGGGALPRGRRGRAQPPARACARPALPPSARRYALRHRAAAAARRRDAAMPRSCCWPSGAGSPPGVGCRQPPAGAVGEAEQAQGARRRSSDAAFGIRRPAPAEHAAPKQSASSQRAHVHASRRRGGPGDRACADARAQATRRARGAALAAADALLGSRAPLAAPVRAMLLGQAPAARGRAAWGAADAALALTASCPRLGARLAVGRAWAALAPAPPARPFELLEAALAGVRLELAPDGACPLTLSRVLAGCRCCTGCACDATARRCAGALSRVCRSASRMQARPPGCAAPRRLRRAAALGEPRRRRPALPALR